MSIIGSCFAAARRHLDRARVAQRTALIWSVDVYKAGERGRHARMLHQHWHARRADHLAEALRIRRQIHGLRAELRALELEDTIPGGRPPRAA